MPRIPPESLRAFGLAAILVLPLVCAQGFARSPGASSGWVQWPEEKALDFDYRVRALVRTRRPPDDAIRLVLEDDEAAQAATAFESDWDFFRTTLSKIAADRPRAVFVDYEFRSPTSKIENAGNAIDDTIRRAAARTTVDPELAQELTGIADGLRVRSRFLAQVRAMPVLLPVFCGAGSLPVAQSAQNDPGFLKSGTIEDENTPARFFGDLVFPDKDFVASAQEVAGACETPDDDGVLRRWLAFIATDRAGTRVLVPSVPVTLARLALGLPAGAVRVDSGIVHVGDRAIPVDALGRALIDFDGARGAFRSRARKGHPIEYSAAAVLDGRLRSGTFTDKVVFFGAAEHSSHDLKPTPFSYDPVVPGVEVLAIATASVLESKYPLRHPATFARYGFLLTALIGILAASAGRFLPLPRGGGLFVLCFGVPASILLGSALLFAWAGIWIDSAYPAMTWTVAIVAAGFERYRNQAAERRLLESAFKLYLSPEKVDSVLRDPSSLRLEGQERELTILFSDLRGFTTRAERLPATEMVALLNEHLTAMHEVVSQHGGTLDKFIGDCVMAFWGAPTEDREHALHACRAGERMLERLAEMNRARAESGREQLDVGVGICTGRVIVGNMGSENRFDYTVIGDAVNLASRLEGLTRDAGYGVLIGEATRTAIGEGIPVDELGPMKVKGKAAAVRVFGLARTRRASVEGAAASRRG